MPLINDAIDFNDQELAIIEAKLSSKDFSHTEWGSEDLAPIRKTIRTFYRQEQSGICAYCKNNVSLVATDNAHIEHIAPKSLHLNFIFEPKNLCVVCADCNTIKRNQEVLNQIPDTLPRTFTRYPRSSQSFRIVHPHIDNYDDHILIKGRIYIDKTAKGHFTIGACKLNRHFWQFGFSDDFVDDEQLIAVMNGFIEGRSAAQRAKALNDLIGLLI